MNGRDVYKLFKETLSKNTCSGGGENENLNPQNSEYELAGANDHRGKSEN